MELTNYHLRKHTGKETWFRNKSKDRKNKEKTKEKNDFRSYKYIEISNASIIDWGYVGF
jgi:hypothetical protein